MADMAVYQQLIMSKSKKGQEYFYFMSAAPFFLAYISPFDNNVATKLIKSRSILTTNIEKHVYFERKTCVLFLIHVFHQKGPIFQSIFMTTSYRQKRKINMFSSIFLFESISCGIPVLRVRHGEKIF
jgi:hypothetical protein